VESSCSDIIDDEVEEGEMESGENEKEASCGCYFYLKEKYLKPEP